MSMPTAAADRVGDLLRTASDDQLVRELLADVEAIARSVLGPRDPHLIQTAAHDALLAVVRYRAGFRGASRGSTWLYTVTRREALRTQAREARHAAQEILLSFDDDDGAFAEPATHPSPDAGIIARALLEEAIPNRDWRRIWLLYNDPELRLSHEEVAGICRRSPGTIAVTLSRVRARLGAVDCAGLG